LSGIRDRAAPRCERRSDFEFAPEKLPGIPVR
jgi:hypothetical protein